NFNFENSLIRFNDFNNNFLDNPLYNFENESLYNANVFNEDPLFFNRNANNLKIQLESGAAFIGNDETSNLVPLDLLGNARISPADAGAYKVSELPED
ncbi:MAG: hypothetical protein LAT51_05430, partial [Flavobacteriaceae bacterium]|nr:hypothetical protein [Flavobacteriaceae bacterium]